MNTLLCRAIGLLVLSFGLSLASTAVIAAEKKNWEKLAENPVDYSRFERRRAENAAGETPDMRIPALAQGFAKKSELGSNYVIPDPELTGKIRDRLTKLLAQTPGIKPPPIEFIILDDIGVLARAKAATTEGELVALLQQAQGSYNAYATSGGAIVIGLSTLAATTSFDEFDFLVGHESSHILYDHFRAQEIRKQIERVAAAGVVIARITGRYDDGDAATTIAWSAIGLALANKYLAPAWDRAQEYEADELGIEFILQSGMSAKGADKIFGVLEDEEKRSAVLLDKVCGPDTAIERTITDLLPIPRIPGLGRPKPSGLDPNNPICAERKSLIASWFKSHPDAADRREAVQEHIQTHYKGLPERGITQFRDENEVSATNLLQFLAPNGDANRSYLAYQGREAVRAGNWVVAEQIAKRISVRGNDEILVPVLELNYRIAKHHGRNEEALRYIMKATRAPQIVPEVFELAASELEIRGRFAEAAGTLQNLKRFMPALAPMLLPKIIRYFRLAGDVPQMQAALAECRSNARSEVATMCEASAIQ